MTVPQQTQQQALFASDRVPNEVISVLEQFSLKVPFEEARRYSRANQRILEKELPALLNAYKEKAGSDSTIEQRFQERLSMLNDRVEQNYKMEEEYLGKLKFRQEYLNKLTSTEDTLQYQDWVQIRLKRLVIEYSLDAGDIEFAESLIPELQVEKWIDVEVFSDRNKILREMEDDKSFQSALQWCSENRQSLKKSNSILEFMLRRQEMIELAGKGNFVEAISYGKKYLFSWLEGEEADSTLLELAESAMGLIMLCDRKTTETTFAETKALFKKEYNQMYHLFDFPLLLSILQAGLTLIKTPNCGDPDFFNINCPACQPELAKIAANLPYAHHDNSILVCRITGERMVDDNPPMVLPNGNVYSFKGLKKYAGEGAICAKCPRTGAEYPWEELRKVFIT